MKDRTRRGLDVLQAALILGIVGDALLRATPWGLNVLLWMVLFVAAGLMLLVRWRRNRLSGDAAIMFTHVSLFLRVPASTTPRVSFPYSFYFLHEE